MKKIRKIPALLLLLIISVRVCAAGAELPALLVPMGQTAGVRLDADGLMVVERSDERGANLKAGDFINALNGEPIADAAAFQKAIRESGGKSVTLEVTRAGTRRDVEAKPFFSEDEAVYKLGVWVRDTVSGIGTLTFYDPDGGFFGALGHGINDGKTLIPISGGDVLTANVTEIRRGASGAPGELRGDFTNERECGKIIKNTPRGLFGIIENPEEFKAAENAPLELGGAKKGAASILANISGKETERYEIEITDLNSAGEGRDFGIKITDERLLSATGGIVQGMSGSPVIQDGKLVGAVTHVLVSDPRRGYGIYIAGMLGELYA